MPENQPYLVTVSSQEQSGAGCMPLPCCFSLEFASLPEDQPYLLIVSLYEQIGAGACLDRAVFVLSLLSCQNLMSFSWSQSLHMSKLVLVACLYHAAFLLSLLACQKISLTWSQSLHMSK